MEPVTLGTEARVLIKVIDISNVRLEDCQFACKFYCNDKENLNQIICREQMMQVDEDSYIAFVDSSLVGLGRLRVDMLLFIPDASAPSGNRQEPLETITDIEIVEPTQQ